MDVVNLYTDFLSLFLALVVAGVGIKQAFLTEHSNGTYRLGEYDIPKHKAHTAVTVVGLGVVIQLVANSVESLNGTQLLQDPKVLTAYAGVFLLLALKK